MRSIMVACIAFMLAVLIGTQPIHAQGPTETPTPTPTETETATPTITPTSDLFSVMTLEPSGRSGAIIYVATVGDMANFSILAFIAVLLMFSIFLNLRNQRK